jgi:hypothetical protein
MRPFETHRVPLITSLWMIGVPLFFAFVAGAGAGTAIDGLARFAGTLFAGFGGASLILGVALLAWVLWSAWRGPSKDVHG